MLRGRRALLAVTGGVAAYKSAELARRLVEAGAEVEVVMTESSLEFIGPQTLAAVTGRRPRVSLFGDDSVSPHTELARWCDIVVVAPATASTMGKVANGIPSDLVSAALTATKAPTLLAPAMHTEMWEHEATQRNVARLRELGCRFVGPGSGPLADGAVGPGRMAEPAEIVEAVAAILSPGPSAARVLITAGGTREPLDPVRFIGNRSSGKMGHAVASEAARRGCAVTLVTTSDLPAPRSARVVRVETADEMCAAVSAEETDIAVMTAAVADFKPSQLSEEKISRADGPKSIPLSPTPDVLATVAAREARPIVVGFAAETGGVARAVSKAVEKGVDLLVYNDVTAPGSGFGADNNQVVVIDPSGAAEEWPMMSKRAVAARLIDRALAQHRARR